MVPWKIEFIRCGEGKLTGNKVGFAKAIFQLDIGEGDCIEMQMIFNICTGKNGLFVSWPYYTKKSSKTGFEDYVTFGKRKDDINKYVIDLFKEWQEDNGLATPQTGEVSTPAVPASVAVAPASSATRRRSVSWKTTEPIKIG